ncbi:translation initiation factor IF-3 [Candidatus Vidania fulgoroideorum]
MLGLIRSYTLSTIRCLFVKYIMQIKLIGSDGKFFGVVNLTEAQSIASKQSLDLILINDRLSPPIYRLGDNKKYLFDMKKKSKRIKRTLTKTKEITLLPNIGNSDYLTKLRKIVSLRAKGYNIRIYILFRGRQIVYQHLGHSLINRIENDLHIKVHHCLIRNKISFLILPNEQA